MTVKRLGISRGHIHIEIDYSKFVHIPGEMTLLNKFYVNTNADWYWIEEPSSSYLSIDKLKVVSVVTKAEKEKIINAINEYNKCKKIKIIFD